MLNVHQEQILQRLKVLGESLDIWLSTPNPHFNHQPPLDLLLTENYDYFYRFLGHEEVKSHE
jgi:hypothetical protein